MIEQVKYGGWENCYRLHNNDLELIVTADVGPRIIRFGYRRQPNVFYEAKDDLGKVGGDEWRLYGGHRLWHAPESSGRTTQPDNDPVEVEIDEAYDAARFTQAIEPQTGIQKELIVSTPSDGCVTVIHRLRNCGMWDVSLSVWGLSVMAAGGTAIIPLPPRGTHPENLLPNVSLVLWQYTHMDDPRWMWGSQYILLRQIRAISSAQKIGVVDGPGWLAYANENQLFVKTFEVMPNVEYPDRGCSSEVFTNPEILELESLSRLWTLAPGEQAEHVERWSLFRDVQQPAHESNVVQSIAPLLNSLF